MKLYFTSKLSLLKHINSFQPLRLWNESELNIGQSVTKRVGYFDVFWVRLEESYRPIIASQVAVPLSAVRVRDSRAATMAPSA